ncbi:fungal-specific transcription factor domain-containing protein [Aspergillus avenaceus]|uniref:Fungal-specific transcription factor domain-containing protein n=1 Tax=Aspergillus avenaceus TaxID=36643 RepID=A0A5N6THP7_ASPAV|nr:fungal-specific transcription factor domain-containing protein [Aspergillus avenaceus]
MSSDMRQASGSSKTKRRFTDADEVLNLTPDENASNPKRQRVSRACDSCRSKKDKCDGIQPVCSTCASLSRPCTYKANPKKRGLPTGYIRTLELLWGLVFSKIKGSEDVVRALLKATNMPSHLSAMGKEAEGSDTLLFSWKNSAVLKDVERMLTLLEQPEDDQEKETRVPGDNDSPQEVEGTTVMSSDALEWFIPEGLGDGRESSVTGGPSPVKTPTITSTAKSHTAHITRDSSTQTTSFRASSEAPKVLVDHSSSETHTTFSHSEEAPKRPPRLPSNTWALIDIYFTYTQCWFPILEKHDILRTAFRHSENDTPATTTSTGSGNYAALWAVLALASIQEASITATRQLPQPCFDQLDSNHLYAIAKSLIPREEGIHDIGHVQALLILSLVKLGQQDWTAAWMLVGQAVRISQCLKLGLPPDAQSGGEEAKASGRTKHVFLGCFVLETLVAKQMDQTPSLRKGDLMKVGPINEDGLEEWHPWEDQTGLKPIQSSRNSFHRGPLHALSTFNRLISLTCVLNELCFLKQSMASTMSEYEALERQLQIWISSLPKSYRVDTQTNSAKPAPPHVFGLEMMYEGIVATLSLEFAVLRGDKNIQQVTTYKIRATESSKRLLLLLQTYMETYSLSATFPTFGVILTLGSLRTAEMQRRSLLFDLESGLKQKLQSFTSHLATTWATQGKGTGKPQSVEITPAPSVLAVHRQRNVPTITSSDQNSFLLSHMPTSGHPMQRTDFIDRTHLDTTPTDPFLSNSWARTASNTEEAAALSLPTPTPSVNINRPVETPHLISQTNDSASHRQRASISSTKQVNGTSSLSDLTSPLHPVQYQTPYSESNHNVGSFIDIEGYGSLQRPRIAPDLDALFDELASLDGTEQADNQPEFMQNLGFVPDAGIPELYSYSSQVEPFLLAQAQQMPASDHQGVLRRESQPVHEPQASTTK